MTDWKFDLDEVGPDAEPDESDQPEGPPIEPGSPMVEHVLPFLAGVALALFIFAQVI